MMYFRCANMEDRYVGRKDAAEFLGISTRTIARNLDTIPHYRFGGKILFLLSELHAMMQGHRETEPQPDAWKGGDRSQTTTMTKEQFERAAAFMSPKLRERLAAEFQN